MQDLSQLLTVDGVDLTGWTLDQARGISADGYTIVGTGHDPSGNYAGWIAVLPEPGLDVLLLTAVLGDSAMRRRRS